jgi:pimeloyl-ACP methyl ester carboxylesterase
MQRLPTIGTNPADNVSALDHLEVRDSTLVGHTLGGAVAAAACSRTPAVTSLALLAPAGFGRIRLAEFVSTPGIKDVAEKALPLALLNPLVCTAAYSTFVSHRRLPSKDLVDRLRRRAWHSGPGVRAAVEAIAHAAHDPRGFTKRAIEFDGPVAALWGEHDALVSVSHIRALRDALPQAHVEVWPGMGHHPQRERARRLAKFIEDHASKVAPRRRAPRRKAA